MLDVDRDGNVLLSVHVQPGARTTEVVGRHGDALKVRIAAPPVDGKANRAVLALIAETFDTPVSNVELAAGASNRRKRIKISGLTAEAARERLAPWIE